MKNKTKAALGLTVTAVLFVMILLMTSIAIIPTGYVGVKSRFGAVQDNVIQEGFNFKAPIIEKITKIDCRIKKAEVESSAASKDLQTVAIKIAVNYNVRKESANTLFKEVGTDFQSVIVDPAILESIKGATAQYTAEELITRRNEVSNQMTDILTDKIESRGFQIIDFNIINLDFSEEYNKAVENKQVIEQEAKAAQYELEKQQINNQIKINEAQANAEVMRLQNEAITDKTLELKRLENQAGLIKKWNGELPSTMLGDSVPLLNIDPE